MTNEQTRAAGVISATLVPENERLGFLPAVFGAHFLEGEDRVFSSMAKLCQAYDGGYWDFYTLSNGGGYMAPSRPGHMHLTWHLNNLDAVVSAGAAGVVATLFALGHLSCKYECDQLIEGYHRLRDYALQHPEGRQILAAID